MLEYKAALNREQLNAFLNPPPTDRDKLLEWQEDWQPKNSADVLLYDCTVRELLLGVDPAVLLPPVAGFTLVTTSSPPQGMKGNPPIPHHLQAG